MPDPAFSPETHRFAEPRWFDDLRVGERFFIPSRTMTEALFAAFQLASAEGRILLEINEALRRIARQEYGRCESCENPILRARLEAMPTARLCLSCKEKEERAARGMS